MISILDYLNANKFIKGLLICISCFCFFFIIFYITEFNVVYLGALSLLFLILLLSLKREITMYLVFVLSIITNFSYYTINKFGIPIIPITTLLATIPLIKKLMISMKNKEVIICNKVRNIVFAIVTFIIVYSSIGAINNETSVFRSYPYDLLTGFIILLYLILFIDNDYKLTKILEIIIIGGCILGVTIIFDAYQLMNLKGFRSSGWLGAPNEAAYIMNLCLFSTVYLEKRFLYSRKKLFFIKLFYFISILLTLSRIGIALAIILLISNTRFSKRQIFLYSLTALIGIKIAPLVRKTPIFYRLDINRLFFSEAFSMTEYSNGRLPALLASMKIFLEHPIIGVGIGNSSFESSKYLQGFTYVKAHNMWGLILSETGFIPFTILVFIFVLILRTIKTSIDVKHRKTYIIFVYILLIETFFSHNLIFFQQTWLFLGVIFSDINMAYKETNIKRWQK